METLYCQEIAGGGPPLLILHGLFGCGRNWRGLASRLAPEQGVVLVDLRNHGRSFHSDRMTFAEMADDVERLRVARGWGRMRLLGHSLGGKVVLSYALRHPERVTELVVVDIAPKDYSRLSRSFQPIITAMRRLDRLPFPRRGDMVRRLTDELGGAEVLAQFLVTSNYAETGWLLNLPVLEREMPHLLSWPDHAGLVYRGPSLLLRGQRSDFVADEDESLFAPLLPRFSAEVVADAGHNVHTDQPEVMAGLLEAFSDRVNRDG